MAIGFSLGQQWAPSDAESVTGMPSFADALHKGIMSIGQEAESRAKPKQLAEQILAAQLQNKISKAAAEYAMKNQQAALENTMANTGLTSQNSLRQQILNQLLPERERQEIAGLSADARFKNTNANILENSVNQDQILNEMLSKATGQNTDSNNLSAKINAGFNSNKSVVEQGNSELYKIDEVYDNYPQLRKELEKRGFKATQEVKYDPKTGVTTTIKRKPSGKVEISSTPSPSANQGFSQNTNAIRTANQKTINSIRNARPIIQKIINDTKKGKIPGQMLGQYFSPDRQASYISDVIQSADTLAGAFQYPNTEGGLNAAKETVLRKPRETDAGYIKRLESLMADMDNREKNAAEVVRKGTETKKSRIDTSKYDLPEGSVILYKDGEGYVFPEELVNQKLSEGYGYE